jgi:hypothetical protein
MELGNAVFGNSRGQFELPRHAGFEHYFFLLMDICGISYYEEYENDVFCIFPYYWGDCTCGFSEEEFEEAHRPECYQEELRREKLKNGWVERGSFGFLEFNPSGKNFKLGDPDGAYREAQAQEEHTFERIVKSLYEKRGWADKLRDWRLGSEVHCDCDYDERYESWARKRGYPDGHKPDCLLVKPNFLYKPTGFEIQWYKYPFRDSYTNKKISIENFQDITLHCIDSVRGGK